MKSFKVLVLLTLAATLSCGSPTNVTQATDDSTDGFIKVIKRKTQANELLDVEYIEPIIRAALGASHNKNEELTKNFVEGMWDNNKNYNYVVCRPPHTAAFDGVERVDWAQGVLSGFNKVKYDIFIAGSGTFTRGKKSGYGNWAWKGSVKKGQDLHSNVVHFVAPGTAGVIDSGGD